MYSLDKYLSLLAYLDITEKHALLSFSSWYQAYLFIEKKIMPYIKISLSQVWEKKASSVTIQTCSSIPIIEIMENKTPPPFSTKS